MNLSQWVGSDWGTGRLGGRMLTGRECIGPPTVIKEPGIQEGLPCVVIWRTPLAYCPARC